MEKMLKGKVCIVTGSGRGIGRADALLLGQEGGKVVINDIDPEPANQVMEEIKAFGGEAICVPGDLTDGEFPGKLISETVKAFGPSIDVIVNNAGYTWDGTVHKMTDKQFLAILEIHNVAPFRIIRAAAPYMRDVAKKEKKEGRTVMRKIINVSSLAGVQGNAGQINYSTAKAGVVGMTKALAREWGQFNINVNAVAYGFIETRMTQAKEQGASITREGETISIGVPETSRDIFAKMCPLGRAGTPEEAARPVLFLASPLSDYVSGHVLIVDGGGL